MGGGLVGNLQTKPLGALGTLGQNSQAAEIDLPSQFATQALNVVLDQGGRMTARKSMTLATISNADLGAVALKRVYRHNKADGTSEMVSSGNSRIFTGSSTLTSRSSGHSADRFQFASLNGKLFAAQASHTLRYFNEGTWAETTVATPASPNCIHAAYGRLWAADITNNNYTLYWSDLLDGTNFTTGASGSLDLNKIATSNRDRIVAISSFNRQIVVFGRYSIYFLGLANDLNPSNVSTPIYLADFIPNVGCIARDSIVQTGEDIVFLADDGLRSLSRSVQEREGPVPMGDLTAANTRKFRSEVISAAANAADLTAAWWPNESWYVLFSPTTSEVWVFDMANRVPEVGAPVTTVWRTGTRPVYHAAYWTDDLMYFAGTNATVGGLFKYEAYDTNDSYTAIVTTGWLSLENPATLKHLKKMLLNVRGGGGQTGFLRWYVDFNETDVFSATFTLGTTQNSSYYNVAEYNVGEYTSGVAVTELYVQMSQSAKYIKFSIELPVGGSEITLSNAQAFFTQGRTR